jgi:hypothetical protein
MRRLLVMFAVLAMFGLAFAAAPGSASAQNPVAGVYDVAGKNPDGSAYVARVKVEETGDTFALTWVDGAGNESYGRGVLLNGTLAVGGILGQNGFVFAMTPDASGNLAGVWTDMVSGTTLGSEVWTRSP